MTAPSVSKKSLTPNLLENTFFQCRNMDISPQKCGLKLSLLPFSTADSLIHSPELCSHVQYIV